VDYFSHFAFGENCVAADNTHPRKIVVLEKSLFLLSFGVRTGGSWLNVVKYIFR